MLALEVPAEGDRTTAVIGGFNRLLTHPRLLEELLIDEGFLEQVLEPPVRRALQRVPIARRMLFENAKIAAEIAKDPDLVDDFAARSAAIRVLNARAPQIFKTEPGLLPLIVFGLYGGAIADAVDRRLLVLVTTSGQALLAGVLVAQALLGLDRVAA